MHKSDYMGWREVFRFSLIQGLKEKSYIVMVIIFGLMIMIGLPAMTWFSVKDADKVQECEIEKVIIYNETELSIDNTYLLTGERYHDLPLETGSAGYAEDVKALEEAKESGTVVARLEYRQEEFVLTFVKSTHSSFGRKDFESLISDFQKDFIIARRRAMEVTDEQAAFMNRPVSREVLYADTDENGEVIITPGKTKDRISMTEYYILLGGNMLVIMLVSFSGSAIATSIVTEKSTRVVEYLMIHVRPMALIVGKILASLLQVILQMGVMGVCYVIGSFLAAIINLAYGGGNAIAVSATDGGMENATEAFLETFSAGGILNILISVIIIGLGVLFFAIVAGLAGASVSKMEELAEGLKLYQLFMIGGSYLGLGLSIAQMAGNANIWVIRIFCMIPVAAPFVVPANLLLGKIGILTALVSVLILFGCTFGLFVFTARVYESMIFYNGKVLKLKDILKIAKERGTKEAKQS